VKQNQLCLMSYTYVMCGTGGHVALGTHFEYRLRFLLLSIISFRKNIFETFNVKQIRICIFVK